MVSVCCEEKGHQEFPPEIINFPLSKNQTKWAIELWTLKQEMETDDVSPTMRESFTMVQNIDYNDIDIDYNDILLAHE